jgi:hypothetical protein
MGFAERALAAAGAAVVSAVLVNPLDVAKVRTGVCPVLSCPVRRHRLSGWLRGGFCTERARRVNL